MAKQEFDVAWTTKCIVLFLYGQYSVVKLYLWAYVRHLADVVINYFSMNQKINE
jgi:hypothetical protein